MSAALEFSEVSHAFSGREVLRGLSLRLEAGALLALVGPSGCGKTTLLRLIAGLLPLQRGALRLGGVELGAVPAERRGIGVVFQSYALFPFLDARDNVAFGLRVRGVGRAARRSQAEAMLARVGLDAAAARRRPAELSGGQQQRVALARALILSPALLLLDEPFANLDRGLREQLRGELAALHEEVGTTTILVTHDREEALDLGDVVGVMAEGELRQLGAPEELYGRPRDAQVAAALGEACWLEVAGTEDGQLRTREGLSCPIPEGARPRPGDRLLVRPEQLRPAPGGVPARVRRGRFLGGERLVELELAGGARLRARVPAGCALGEVEGWGLTGQPWVLPGSAGS